MAYNHRKAEIEWLNWKEKEEKQMRELGVDEDTIQRLHTYDWQQFNKERQYQQRWRDRPIPFEPQGEQKLYLQTVDTLLDEIDNEQLWEVLRKTDKLTLKMLVMKMQGFSGKEIFCATGVPESAINNRIARLRKKIKNFL
ncbi:sigma-70 family RNA polymerase sigma factor [Ruthenibacterium lactatiformans]|uniref:Sigma-70 family RNA polymerase sigma factor n=1 Tax=Ruthenibacterium lactatiformans TaxID=1550024 RepID=A0A6I2UAR1_9FIRM|nr:sigma-70 family RNA polymerase sigma factor [Ruthenibacterium lactatiformans]MST93029.1 sigma-70 family RNA polymerase sigma factor [Ruthenibacterium lactatiformans]